MDISRYYLSIVVFIEKMTKHEVEGIATLQTSDKVRCYNEM